MDRESQQAMIEYYSKMLVEHGDSLETLIYRSPLQQIKRFSLLTDIGPIDKDGSILDVGCGLGHLCDFMRQHGWKGKYTGIDINPDLLAAAKKRLPDDQFVAVNILTEKFEERHDYVFCGAAIQHRPRFVDPKEYLRQMIEKMFSLTNKALSFDIFSNRVDYMDDDKLYSDPLVLLDLCYQLTRRVILRNDCRPYELMMVLYRPQDIDEFNIFTDWVEQKPLVL